MAWLLATYLAGVFMVAYSIARQVEASFWGVLAVVVIGTLWLPYYAVNVLFWAFGELLTAAIGE